MKTITQQIPYIIIKEGNAFIAYSPALELTTQGDSYEHAREMFHEAAQLFIEGLEELGTTQEYLEDHGWVKSGKEFIPPQIVGREFEELPMQLSLSHA
ncbi:MAG: hypothetical protein A2V81_01455 [Candidatus Abawacabacteria bacterium RBG_16_42_10]|uniref:HicB-like antitoxin of toxin-antitoxin system domain-containing protein n=1 Tax=Candidatus Abawacabacteria bacterium RBG_16_42_10 TaxID=1817814 RepID=A0A1F4XNE2_9BACT|nr:MAG: hypothetical protein A2V81_01455 [Candidatus Abawacabacteria bacterium RBG_16_42_10]